MDDSGLLQYLIGSHDKSYQKSLPGERPWIATEPERFLPKQPAPAMGDFERLIASSINPSAGGFTNNFFGNVGYSPDFMAEASPDDFLEAAIHENTHSTRIRLPMAGKQALYNRSVEMFGGEDQYKAFMDKLRPQVHKDHWMYKLQHMIPYLGPKMAEEELLAYLIGKVGRGHSKESFREAANQTHPKASEWFDMQTTMPQYLK